MPTGFKHYERDLCKCIISSFAIYHVCNGSCYNSLRLALTNSWLQDIIFDETHVLVIGLRFLVLISTAQDYLANSNRSMHVIMVDLAEKTVHTFNLYFKLKCRGDKKVNNTALG